MEDLSLPVPRESARRSRRIAFVVLGLGLTILGSFAVFAMNNSSPAERVRGFELVANQEGVVASISVQLGQTVKEGDLLMSFEDHAEQAELVAAREALQSLASEVGDTSVAVAIPSAPGVTGRIVPIGPLPDGRPIASSKPFPTLPAPKEGTVPLLPEVGPTTPTIDVEALVRSLESELTETRNSVLSLQHRIQEARTEAEDATKNADAAKVIAQQRKQQSDKMRMLLGEGVVSQLETARAEVQYASAQGGFEAAQQQAEAAHARVKALEADLVKTESRVPELEKAIAAAKDAAQVAAKQPTPTIKPPLREVETATVPKPAYVRPEPLPNEPTKVIVDKGAIREADQQLAAAKARVDSAEAALRARTIYATRTGTVVKILVKQGEQVRAGQAIAIIR